MRNQQFGVLVNEGVASVAHRWRKTRAGVLLEMRDTLLAAGSKVKDSTLAGWCKGFVPKEPELVAWFTRYCVRQGRVDHQWAESLLRYARYPEREQLLGELFPAAIPVAPADLVRGEESANGKQAGNPTTAQFSVLTTNLAKHEPPHHSAPALPVAEPYRSLWQVPYPRNPHFTGRDEILDQLAQHFSSRQKSNPMSPHPVALTQPQAIKGLGGIGKTQIALEYAYRSLEQNRYTHTFWINAASSEAIMTSFMTLADLFPAFPAKNETDQHKLVAAIKRWLEQCQQPWLLIFDNADDLPLAQEYFPTTGNGNILLTTRANAVGSLAASLEVETLGFLEGTQFLLRRTHRLAGASEEAINEAGNLVVTLDHFPLALDQAGAYIEETGCSFSDYLRLYQDRHQVLLARRGAQATYYPDSVATTWSLSFQRVEQANPAAAELLRLCAFLAPDHIPEELFKEGAAHWPSSLQQASTDLLAFNQMLEELLRFSLVKRLAEHNVLSIHRLVQVVQQDALPPGEQRLWAERVVRAVHAAFPCDPKDEISCWPQCLRYLEQAQACDTLIREYGLLLPEAAELLDRTGAYLSEHASYSLAEPLYQQAAYIWEQTKGPECPEVAQSLNELACLYLFQGKYAQAEPLFQRAVHIWEQAKGPEHPDVAAPLNRLAIIYRRQGNYQQAELLYQRSLHIREQALGPEHPDVASPLHNLADLYLVLGKYTQAELLDQRALRILEQAYGPEHPRIPHALNGLAEIYRMQEKYEQAEPLYQRALHIWEQVHGLEHPGAVYLLHNLAELYRMQEKYEQAEPLYQRALHTWEQTLGPDHPDTGYPLQGLALLYSRQDKDEQAEHLFQRALQIWEQALGGEHPNVASALIGLADLSSKRGRDQEVEGMYQRALSIQERALGPHHLDTGETLHGLASLRVQQGHLEEAASLYRRVLAVREHVYGPQHPKTTDIRKRLHAVSLVLERTEEVERHKSGQQGPAERKDMEQNAEVGGDFCSDLPACPHCRSAGAVVKSGTNQSGSRRFRCQRCQRYFTPQAVPRGYKSRWKEQALLLARQGKSYRFIARQVGVNHRTIRAWIKASERDGNGSQHE